MYANLIVESSKFLNKAYSVVVGAWFNITDVLLGLSYPGKSKGSFHKRSVTPNGMFVSL